MRMLLSSRRRLSKASRRDNVAPDLFGGCLVHQETDTGSFTMDYLNEQSGAFVACGRTSHNRLAPPPHAAHRGGGHPQEGRHKSARVVVLAELRVPLGPGPDRLPTEPPPHVQLPALIDQAVKSGHGDGLGLIVPRTSTANL